MALTRITLLLTEDHAYGIFYWLAGGVSHARWQEFWQLLPMVVVAVPVVLLAVGVLVAASGGSTHYPQRS